MAVSLRRSLAVLCVGVFLIGSVYAQSGATDGQWPSYGGDVGSTKHSTLDQIGPDNFDQLKVAWQWESPENERIAENRRLRTFAYEATPIVVNGVMYTSSSHCDVIAIDPETGKTLWTYETESYKDGRPTNLGFVHRGVTFWDDGEDGRIFIAAHDSTLHALNAKTGDKIRDFGRRGKVDLGRGLRRNFNKSAYAVTSPPVVCRGVVVVGSAINDAPTHKLAPPGDVRGYDAMTGELRWVFESIPQEGEFGNDTWEDGSWEYTGNANVWTLMSADEEHGLVYLPFGTPTNDWYGGHRPGDGLFGETLVCVDAETGKRVWHFQHVHHGVWDYDLCAAPALMDITVDGKEIQALAQITKQGFCWVLDRTTGEPVWPIEERAVPQSTVPGEKTSATQPFPEKPAPFEVQGVHEEDLIDFTPELRAQALEILKDYNWGPLYTPPSEDKPTVYMPGWAGGGNWNGCSFDPETQTLYIPSGRSPITMTLSKPDPNRSDLRYRGRVGRIAGPSGLPLFKPPYLHVVAIDMKSGLHKFDAAIGDGPRDHPLLKDLDLPKLGDRGRTFIMTTKTLLLIAHSSGKLYAFDKETGEELGIVDLPSSPTGSLMTYEVDGKQYIAIPSGGRGGSSGLVTLSL